MQDNRMRFTLRLPKDLYGTLKNIAAEKGVSVNSVILQILWDWTKKNTSA